MKISIKMLIGTLLAGILYGVCAEFLYDWLHFNAPSIVTTLVYFGGLFFVLGGAVALVNKVFYSHYRGGIHKKAYVISIIVMLVCTVLFEFIYDFISERKWISGKYDSYIFVVDNSGSMDISDPRNERYDVIEELLSAEDDDFEFAIYTFSNNVFLAREMGPISDGFDFDRHDERGMTYMYSALSQVLDDIDNDVLEVSKNTRVVLLTDGDPSDGGSRSTWLDLMDEYVDRGITISTVGLNYSNDKFMGMIADSTGGAYVSCDDVDELAGSLSYAITYNPNYRNLLGLRRGDYLNALLAVLRILFVGGLGVIVAFQKTALCEKFINTNSVIISSAISGILAGICIEIGMNGLGLNEWLMRILTCALIGFTVLRVDLLGSNNSDDILYNGGRY